MKKFLSLLLALLLVVIPLRGVTAQAASTFVPREGSVAVLSSFGTIYAAVDQSGELWVYYLDVNEPGNVSLSKCLTSGVSMIAGGNSTLMVLKQDGALWTYKFNDNEILGPLKLMDGIAKVVENGYYNHFVLGADGTCSNIELAYTYVSTEPVSADYEITLIDTGVADIYSGGIYIKGNEVRNVYNGQSTLDKTLDFSNGKRIWCYNGSCFVATDDGTLWSWGRNVRGQLGNGGQYDSAGSIMYIGEFEDGVMAYPVTNSQPTEILSNVESMWFGDGCIRAVDSSGTVWQWGDGENIMTYVQKVSDRNYTHGELIYPDGYPNSFGYIPREVTPEEWIITTSLYDDIRFGSDGSLWGKLYSSDENFICISGSVTSASGIVSTPEVYDSPTGFTDIRPGYYCEEAVIWAVANGITTGTTTTTFSPDDTCTQGQILTFLWRAAGCPSPDESNVIPFEGSSAQFYYQAVQWALQSGLAERVSAEQECRRSDVVTYLWKLAGCPQAEYSGFTDVNAQDSYATAVAWAVDNGITTGTSATTFSPADTCTRGQIVTFLYRYFTAAEEEAYVELA